MWRTWLRLPRPENLLTLKEPRAHTCHLTGYHTSHGGNLYIAVQGRGGWEDSFVLCFMDTQYFEGPLFWNYAWLALGSRREFGQIKKKLRIEENWLNRLQLFKFFAPGFTVKIIADPKWRLIERN